MIKRMILGAGAFLLTVTANAAPLTADEALARALTGDAVPMQMHGRQTAASFALAHTFVSPDGAPALYLYSRTGSDGFLLLGADSAVPAVLGYSDHSNFDLLNLPPALEGLLAEMAAGVEAARGEDEYEVSMSRAADKDPIAPMLATKWDQEYPYNILCPSQGNRRCATGCVATSMAQVMKYWEYPAKGKGSISYRPSDFTSTLSLDFSTLTFDWDNMLDTYRGMVPETQALAVATLMKACGYSVRMQYSPDYSGAYSQDIPQAMQTYFGYDSGISQKLRSDYSQDTWNNMVYNELLNVGPVIYGGQSISGGHSFVCDGYDGAGLFHINWGWSGLSDGYFRLDALTPSSVGTGGNYGGYNMAQHAIFGITPPIGRLSVVKNLAIANAAEDSGNVMGQGYINRINDFRNIKLNIGLKVSGGYLSTPLYVTIYERDPVTQNNIGMVYQGEFPQRVVLGDGETADFTARVNFADFNPSKTYFLTVAYLLKGQRNIIGSLTFAASSGVDSPSGDDAVDLSFDGRLLRGTGDGLSIGVFDLGGVLVAAESGNEVAIDLSRCHPGVYMARATDRHGRSRVVRLLLR